MDVDALSCGNVSMAEPRTDARDVPALRDEGAGVGMPQIVEGRGTLDNLAADFYGSQPSTLYGSR
jgi:hypothetical protein